MEFFDVVYSRRSVRSYLPKEVSSELIDKLVHTMMEAPSAGDLKAWKVTAVLDKEMRQKISVAALGQEFLAEAPVVLVFCSDPEASSIKYGERGANFYCVQDATIAAAYCQLAATALGLSTCWVGAFYPDQIKQIANIPAHLNPIALMSLGYEK